MTILNLSLLRQAGDGYLELGQGRPALVIRPDGGMHTIIDPIGDTREGITAEEALAVVKSIAEAWWKIPQQLLDSYEFWGKLGKPKVSLEAWALQPYEAQAEIARLRAVVKMRNRQIRDLRRQARK